jgi:ion channel-forming bestrophin family protein
VRRLAPLLLAMLAYTSAVAFSVLELIDLTGPTDWSNVAAMHSLLGFVISTLLVFRTNTAYDRWWEGRRQWGQLVNSSRSMALKLAAMLGAVPTERAFFRTQIPTIAATLAAHLRGESPDAEVFELPTGVHQPNHVIARLFARLHALRQQGILTTDDLLVLNPEMISFSDVVGACERIRNTPIPYSYSSFLKKFVVVYCLTLPFGYVMSLHYWVVPVVTFIFYVLASLEQIAEEIEDPFGTDANDLPTNEIAAGIRRVVGETLA